MAPVKDDLRDESKRTAAQTFGVLLLFVALILVTVGVIDFISSRGYDQGNGVAWLALLGAPLGAAGIWLVRSGLQK